MFYKQLGKPALKRAALRKVKKKSVVKKINNRIDKGRVNSDVDEFNNYGYRDSKRRKSIPDDEYALARELALKNGMRRFTRDRIPNVRGRGAKKSLKIPSARPLKTSDLREQYQPRPGVITFRKGIRV